MNKNEVIIIIRGLLSSSTKTFDIRNLNEEFKNETGMDIPLFGHSSLSDFLRSVPDEIELRGNNAMQTVHLINNSKSCHIVSLVKRQKCKKNNCKYFFSKRWDYFSPVILDDSFQPKTRYLMPTNNSDSFYFYEFLTYAVNGATFDEVVNLLEKHNVRNKSLKHDNIRYIVKTYPFCVYFNEMFFETEIFKNKILSGTIKLNAEFSK